MHNPVKAFWELLATHFDVLKPALRTVKRSGFLVRKGEMSRDFFLVHSGALRVIWETAESTQTIRFGYKGSVISSSPMLLSEEKPSLYDVQALKKSEVSVLRKSSLRELFRENDKLREAWPYVAEAFIFQQMEREMDLLTDSPRERYLRVLSRSPQVFQHIPSKYIADYLRMTPETLSRIRSIDLNQ